MSAILSILKRELQAYFVSPIAYAFIAVFLLIAGAGFFYGLEWYLHFPAAFLEDGRVTLRTWLVAGRYGIATWLLFAMLFSLPGLAMRLLSEERKSGTVELLFTSPITTPQIVTGKFLAALSVYGMILALTFPYAGILAAGGSPEWGALAAAYLGFFLLGGVFLAAGLFASSLTENQFVALLVTYVVLTPLMLVELIVGLLGSPLDEILAGLSVSIGIRRFALGVIESHFVVLNLLFMFLFVFLSTRVIDSRRWR